MLMRRNEGKMLGLKRLSRSDSSQWEKSKAPNPPLSRYDDGNPLLGQENTSSPVLRDHQQLERY